MASSSVSLPITLREKMTQVGRARSTGPGRGAWETLEFPEFSSFVSGFRNFRSFRRRYLASQRPPAHPWDRGRLKGDGRPRPPARLAAAGNADILEGRGSRGGGSTSFPRMWRCHGILARRQGWEGVTGSFHVRPRRSCRTGQSRIALVGRSSVGFAKPTVSVLLCGA